MRTVAPVTQRRPERRTALITAGGIAAVIVAGAFAVGANIGILDASSDHDIGTLTAAGDLMPSTGPTPSTTAGELAATPIPATPTAAAAQTYVIDVAGTVAVDMTGDDGLRVSTVVANPGWTWSAGPSDAASATLTFSDGVRTLVFTATRTPDGTIDANVTDANLATAATSTAAASPSHDDDDEEDEAHDSHEGRDDDD